MEGSNAGDAIRQSTEVLRLRLARLESERDGIVKEIARLRAAVDTLEDLLSDEGGDEEQAQSGMRPESSVDRGPPPELEGATTLEAAVFVLKAIGRPMSVDDITSKVQEEGYRADDDRRTVRGAITSALGRSDRDGGPVRRVRTGVYKLATADEQNKRSEQGDAAASKEEEAIK